MNFYVSRSGIHFSPSKRTLTKIIFILLGIIAIFFFSIFDVKADYLNDYYTTSDLVIGEPLWGVRNGNFDLNPYQTRIFTLTYKQPLPNTTKEVTFSFYYYNFNANNGPNNNSNNSIVCNNSGITSGCSSYTINNQFLVDVTYNANLCKVNLVSSDMNNVTQFNATCPINGGWNGIVQFRLRNLNDYVIKSGFGINYIFGTVMSDNATINNSVNNVNNSVNNMNDTLNDSSISDEQKTESSGFFTNFQDKDNGGLSSIITAPIRAINSMLSDTCTPLTATYKGKEIRFECGSYWWNKMPQIKAWLNVIYDGLLCFYILKAFYNEIQKLKDPDDESRVEVIDL